jgi:predicted aminopeptidase
MIYVPDDVDFNEALATTVEQEGVRRWLESLGRERDLESYHLHQQHFAQVLDLLTHTRAELRTVYASGVEPARMRREKAAIFDSLRSAHHRLELEWGGHAPLGTWFEGEINNAQLASIATYYDCVPGFQRELEAAGGDLGAFYRRVRELTKLDQKERHAMLCRTP